MTTINDAILQATGGPTLNEGLATWFTKTDDESLQDAERRWLASLTLVDGAINDMWYEMLHAEGHEGSLDDMKLAYWIRQISPKLLFDGTIQGDLATTITIPAGNSFHLIDIFELLEMPDTNWTVRGSGVNSINTVRINASGDLFVNIGGRTHSELAMAVTNVVAKFEAISDGVNLTYYVNDTLIGTYLAPVEDVVHTTVGGNGVGTFNNWRGYLFESSDEDITAGEKTTWVLDSGNTDREPSEEAPLDTSRDLIYVGVSAGDWV